jgi:phosphatidylglycerol:prolipoprotein diacylglycerol transferase
MVNQGGLAVWGGLITGGLAALVAARRHSLPIPRLADATVVGLIVGQMIGRVGCIVNGDAYGGPTSLPWGLIYVNPDAMLPDALRGVPTHPYPIYEILWDFFLLGLLLVLRRHPLPHGLLFSIYAVGYSLGRFSLSFLRQEAVVLWGLQQAQLVALVLLLAAMSGIAVLRWSRARAGASAPRLASERRS